MPDNSKTSKKIIQYFANGDLVGLLKEGITAFFDCLQPQQLTYEEFMKNTGKYIDRMVAKIKAEEKLNFWGGKCLFCYDKGNESISISTRMYFKDQKGVWINKELHGCIPISKFTQEALDNDIKALIDRKQLQFDIDDVM